MKISGFKGNTHGALKVVIVLNVREEIVFSWQKILSPRNHRRCSKWEVISRRGCKGRRLPLLGETIDGGYVWHSCEVSTHMAIPIEDLKGDKRRRNQIDCCLECPSLPRKSVLEEDP